MQAKHRRLRRWEVLWAVYDLSSKWRALVKRKEKRLEAYRIAAARLDTLASENPDFEADISSVKASVQSCVEAATEAQTMDVSQTPPRSHFLFWVFMCCPKNRLVQRSPVSRLWSVHWWPSVKSSSINEGFKRRKPGGVILTRV